VDSTQFGPAALLQDKTPIEPSRHIVRVQHQGTCGRICVRSRTKSPYHRRWHGAALAVALAEAGADVYLIRRRLDKLELVAAKAREYGVNAAVQSTDISTSAGQLEAVQQVRAHTGHLDILVLNAATFAAAPIEDADLSDFDKLYQLNVRAPYALTQAFSPMLKVRRGQVVFINSSSGIAAKPMTGQYDSSKHALKAIADSFRAEVNAHGVRVLSIYLGRTASDAGTDLSNGKKTLSSGSIAATRGCRIGHRQSSSSAAHCRGDRHLDEANYQVVTAEVYRG
jgi:NAD(P)-dependent dehydrogenase (short-subunit alcohol dehydrogenase family)